VKPLNLTLVGGTAVAMTIPATKTPGSQIRAKQCRQRTTAARWPGFAVGTELRSGGKNRRMNHSKAMPPATPGRQANRHCKDEIRGHAAECGSD
jgi:hypothetical protein